MTEESRNAVRRTLEVPIGKKAIWVDSDTGEILEREKNRGRWWMAELAAGRIIATHDGLTDFDRSLMWMLTSYLNFGSFMKVKQAQLAKDMKSSPEQISRSIKRLIAAEVIERSGASKYKLNPAVGKMGARLKKADLAKAKGWETIEGGKESPPT